MKMGLSVLLVGHVNFLLAALVHGVVLRHINLHKQARAMEYAISNVVALTSGLVGVIVGILTIILSKNRRRRSLTWAVFALSLLAALMAAASAIGLSVSVIRAIIYGGRSLLTHCRFPDAVGYSSVTNECPFDPTRIYSTTLILWVPLIVTCLLQLVFSSRCFSTCVSFLGLPCCPARGRTSDYGGPIRVVTPPLPPPEAAPPRRRGYDQTPPRRAEPHRRYDERPTRHSRPPIVYDEAPRRATTAPRQHRHLPPPPPPEAPPPPQRQQRRPRQHHSLTPPERRPLRPPSRERPEPRAGGRHRPAEQHQLMQRGAVERSSFWI